MTKPADIEYWLDRLEGTDIPEYMREGLALYIVKGILPGNFLTQVLEDSLKGAIWAADCTNIQRLYAYIEWLSMNAPVECWGNRRRVRKWIDRGGFADVGVENRDRNG